MDNEAQVILISIAGVIATGILLINGLLYWTILSVKYVSKLNILIQFFGLVVTCVYQVNLLLVNMKYFKSSPLTEILVNNMPFQIFFNCYLIVFIRQCDTLLPRKVVLVSWIYLGFLNAVVILDTYVYYLEFCVSDEWTWLGILMDVLFTTFQLILECIINIWIIFKIVKKVRNQANLSYKILVTKLCITLVLFLVVDIIIISLEFSNNQMYASILMGALYALKIQVEALCLGKIRECIIIMENYENA
ncbi:hypothetical protein CONCODRAFT_4112 [Conidiobolus coronatus NRRL 28638]|uniref:Uncharacterized protein n=1 Tax=Conidiobolus coronatus (strain ATCC 28846 / CBS 209.66 / NRRL 28638) TaxID=796925 RepID=A0A137PD93_CONC2|nr:hypothetical protein CONCODRAFT_4112 [Conidiobolus coronatus NRRL 28638]|eukprot:KXN72967.1 hypothetical protein CONCODRAFT_4112 [Conidiobolus coronatus NRRL 28638]